MYVVKPVPARASLMELVVPSVEAETERKLSLPATIGGQDRIPIKFGGFKTRNSTTSMPDEGKLQDEYTEGNIKLKSIIEGDSDDGVVMCVRFSPDGLLVAAGYSNGRIKVYDAAECQCLHCLGNDDTLSVTCIRFYPASEDNIPERHHLLVATYASGHVRFWHYTSGTCLASMNEMRRRKDTSSFAFNIPGDKFVTVGADPQIFVYDSETRKRVNILEPTDCTDKMDGHRYRVYAVQFHPTDPNVFVTGGWDNTVQFWDTRSRHSFRKLYGPHICGDALDIDPVHLHILTGSWRASSPLQIWDFDTGELLKEVPQDRLCGSLLYCAQWIGKENIACGGSMQNMARVIDRGTLNTFGQLVNLPKGVYAMDNDRQDQKLTIAAAASNKIYLVKLVPK